MGLLNNLVSKLLGSKSPVQPTNPSPASPASPSSLTATVSFSGPKQPTVTISDSEVAEAVERHKFVITNEIGLLKTTDRWFEEATQKRHIRDGSKKAYEWLLPYLTTRGG